MNSTLRIRLLHGNQWVGFLGDTSFPLGEGVIEEITSETLLLSLFWALDDAANRELPIDRVMINWGLRKSKKESSDESTK